MVKHSLHHPKAEGLSTAAATCTGAEKLAGKSYKNPNDASVLPANIKTNLCKRSL